MRRSIVRTGIPSIDVAMVWISAAQPPVLHTLPWLLAPMA